MPKTTLEEKRRETLRRQLYGKEDQAVVRVVQKEQPAGSRENSRTYSLSNHHLPSSQTETLDTGYLARDLTRVLIFSFLAIGSQLTLYFMLQNHLIKLPF